MVIKRSLLYFLGIIALSCYTSKKSDNRTALYSLIQPGSTRTMTVNVNIIGDSLSDYSNAFNLQNRLGNNFAINDFSVPGRDTADWLYDISVPFNPQPDIVIIELGTNDAFRFSTPVFAGNLKTLLNEIESRTKAKIIITAVPLSDDNGLGTIIKKQNDFIRSLAGTYAIADLEKVFEANKTNFRLYPYSDPVHPNPVGYDLAGEEYKKVILSIRQ